MRFLDVTFLAYRFKIEACQEIVPEAYIGYPKDKIS